MISYLRELGMYIQKTEQDIFEACGCDNDKYLEWIKKPRYEFYKYIEMLKASAKKLEKAKK